MDRIKRIVKKTPVVRDLARAAMRQVAARKAAHFNSADYWESRYRDGRDSGAGSYNRLARFKADIINRFVAENEIRTVIEFGCGDGSQLKLATYPAYIGVDVSRTILDATRSVFSDDSTKMFIHSDEVGEPHQAELSLSLDVVYHLVEDPVFEGYMKQLFDAATRFVIVYSSNVDRSAESVHVRHRRFTDWIERNRSDFRQAGFVKNPYPEDIRDPDTSFADFYFFERLAEANQV
jgi:hypothetical protein